MAELPSAPARPSLPAPDAVVSSRQRDAGLRPAVVLGAAAAIVAGVTAAVAPFITPGLIRSFGVPFNPTETLKLQAMLRHLPAANSLRASGTAPSFVGRTPKRRGKIVVDLGSGDGRIIVAAAQQGHDAVGYEFNPWLVLYSRATSLAAGVSPFFFKLRHFRETVAITLSRTHSRNTLAADDKIPMVTPATHGCARFVCGNMWNAPIADASCVVIYGVEELMPRFANKLEQELPLPGLLAVAEPSITAETDAAIARDETDSRLRDGTAPVVVLCNTFPLPGSRWEERLTACEEGVFVYKYDTRGRMHGSI